MLARHTMACAVLPAIYAGKSKVESTFERVLRLQRLLRSIATAALTGQLRLPREHGWGQLKSHLAALPAAAARITDASNAEDGI
jgi:hypothetical protein